MNTNWQSTLEAAGAVFEAHSAENPATVSHFGNAHGELQAAASATVIVPLGHLGLIDVQGEDARAFLHGQFTSDINHLSAGKVQHSAWCTAKGRMLASFLIWRNGEDFRLAVSADLLAAVQKRLQMFVLRAKVKLADASDETVLLGIAGPTAGEALAAANLPMPTEALTSIDADGAQVIRLDGERLVVALPATRAPEVWAQLAALARPAGVPAWRWLDVRAGLPLITAATREEFVPQMADFEKIGGVSFHKGCYPGQEIVARTQYLGKVKRHLYRLDSPVPVVPGDDLHCPENPDQAIGKIVVGAHAPSGGYAALAVIQANFAHDVHLASKDGPTVAAAAINP